VTSPRSVSSAGAATVNGDCALPASPWSVVAQSPSAPSSDYEELLTLFEEFRAFLQPPMVEDGVPDYPPSAIAEQARALEEFRSRLEAIDPQHWPVS
jgi:hypothetical protein